MKLSEKTLKVCNLLKHHKRVKVEKKYGRETIIFYRTKFDSFGFVKEGNYIRFLRNNDAYINIETNVYSPQFIQELKILKSLLPKYLFYYDNTEVGILKNLEKYYEDKFFNYRTKANYLTHKNIKEQRQKKEFELKVKKRRENCLNGFLFNKMVKVLDKKVEPSVKKIGGLAYIA